MQENLDNAVNHFKLLRVALGERESVRVWIVFVPGMRKPDRFRCPTTGTWPEARTSASGYGRWLIYSCYGDSIELRSV